MGTYGLRSIRHAGLLAALLLSAGPALAQSPPPVTGTIALEGTMTKFYRATNVIVVATLDGVEHTYHFVKGLFVDTAKGPEALEGLREGTAVAIHYRGQGTDAEVIEVDDLGATGLDITEGRVARIDRANRQITIRFDNGTVERLQLTERAIDQLGDLRAPDDLRVRVYYVDAHGQKVVHYFKKVEP